LISAAVYLLVSFHKNYLRTSVWGVFDSIYIRPIFAAILTASALVAVRHLIPGLMRLSEVRYLLPVRLSVDFVIFLPVYLVLLVALRQVSTIDWNNFLWLVAFGLEFLRHPFRERAKAYW
jgi:hypothetical protein